MNQSSCGKCGNGSFKVVTLESLQGLRLIQCMACGVPVGVVDGDAEARLGEQKKLLHGLETRLASLEETLARGLNLLRYD